MIVTLPPGSTHLAALSLTGWTRRTGDPANVLRGVVVVKGLYTMESTGSPRIAVPATSAAPVVTSDSGEAIKNGADEEIGYDLRYEADIALEKAHVDIVVEGWTSKFGGSVQVAGETWASRAPDNLMPQPPDPDTQRNLFGWLSRTRDPRAKSTAWTGPDSLPSGYEPGLNNFSRRGAGFTAPTTRSSLPAGATVTVTRGTSASATETLTFTLPSSPVRSARLRAYCGHGPDRPRRWSIVQVIPLVADTLLIRPVGSPPTATLLWRASWRHDAVPKEYWRAVQILEGT